MGNFFCFAIWCWLTAPGLIKPLLTNLQDLRSLETTLLALSYSTPQLCILLCPLVVPTLFKLIMTSEFPSLILAWTPTLEQSLWRNYVSSQLLCQPNWTLEFCLAQKKLKMELSETSKQIKSLDKRQWEVRDVLSTLPMPVSPVRIYIQGKARE